MTFSPLTNRVIPHLGRYNPRKYKISGFTIHHNAGFNSWGEASNPNREVSANYWIADDGTLIGNIPEEYRAWTTGSAGYPAGAESDHRNITVEVSNSREGIANGTWAISAAAKATLEKLIGDVFRRYNLGAVKRATHGGVAVHQDFVPTACPGPYIMSNLGNIIANAEAYRKGGKPSGGAGGSTPSKPSTPSGSITDLARAVIRGEYGNGAERQRRLGANYAAVQAEVNRLLGIGGGGSAPAPSPSITDLAQAVLRGEYGNGAERQRRLGSQYAAVQAEVNRLLGIGGGSSTSKPAPTANISALAQAVLRGDYGNGEERRRRLGANYAAVQAEVNRLLAGGKPVSSSKSIDTIAREVIRGDWGNGADRKARLERAGYNYQAVQNRVNQLL